MERKKTAFLHAHAVQLLLWTWYPADYNESPDYAPEGTAEFKKTLSDGNYLAGLGYYGAFDRERLAGILAIRVEEAHICFFLSREHIIGRASAPGYLRG